MVTRQNRFVSVKWGYSDATAADADIVREVLRSKEGRENVLVSIALVDFNERTGHMSISADLQPGVTVEEVVTAVERKLVGACVQRA